MIKITPPTNALKEKTQPKDFNSGITENDAINKGNEVLSSLSADAGVEIRILVDRMKEVVDFPVPVQDENHEALRCARIIGDMAGTFGFHAVTEIARSAETYLRGIFNTKILPDSNLMMLHAKSIDLMLVKGVSHVVGPADQALLDGLSRAVDQTIAKQTQ